MKKIKTIIGVLFIGSILMMSCEKTEENNSISSDPKGVWQRFGSPNGYQTDLAVGGITGEPSNRVYMCEHPGSPSAGLYKGYISGNIITWDAVHGLPNAEFKPVGNEMTLYFGVGLVSDAGKYKKGIWTNTCGELQYTPKNIYYRWTTGSTCPFPSGYSMTYNNPDLPSSLTQNQLYGPMAAGSFKITVNYSSGSTDFYHTLSPPPTGYKRTYTHYVFIFSSSVNRCQFALGTNDNSILTYVDQPL